MEPSHNDDDLREEYDFQSLPGGQRGKFYQAAAPMPDFEPDEYELTSGLGLKPGQPKLSPEETRQFITRMDTELLPIFSKCVVPIYGRTEQDVKLGGTGTLFRIANRSFLVTAAHVPDRVIEHGYHCCISDTLHGAALLPLHGQVIVARERNVDLAIWELSDDIVAELPNRKFLTIHHADRADRRMTRGWYYVHGYPGCWSEPDVNSCKVVSKSLNYGTVLYNGDVSTFGGYDPGIHILLTIPRTGNVNTNGAPAEMPARLHGISGCSIWQAYYEGLPSRLWTPDDATIVAVQTGTYQDGTVIRGTRWFVVEHLIRKHYPDLAGPMAITTPYARRVEPLPLE